MSENGTQTMCMNTVVEIIFILCSFKTVLSHTYLLYWYTVCNINVYTQLWETELLLKDQNQSRVYLATYCYTDLMFQ